jgi:hypothetical protein
MAPGNPNPSNPPAPVDGAGAKEGRQGSISTPLPRYVITPQELQIKEWLEKAKPGDRLDISSLAPPPPPVGAVRVSEETRFFNFRIRYVNEKKTLVLLSKGFTFTINPLRGVRIYKGNNVYRELNDCWASLIFSLAAKVFGKENNINIFNEKWQSITIPETTPGAKTLIALLASLVNYNERRLKDPFFRACIDGGNSKTP